MQQRKAANRKGLQISDYDMSNRITCYRLSHSLRSKPAWPNSCKKTFGHKPMEIISETAIVQFKLKHAFTILLFIPMSGKWHGIKYLYINYA